MSDGRLKSPVHTAVALVASYAGMIQGVAWIAMSLTGIIFRAWSDTDQLVNYAKDDFNTILNAQIFYTFISLHVPDYPDLFVQANVFLSGMVIYLFLHCVWLGASIYLFFCIKKNFSSSQLFITLIIWTVVMALIIIVDAISFAFVANDYYTATHQYSMNKDIYKGNEKIAMLFNIISYILIATIVARGYVLWFINIILCGYLIKISIDLKTGSDPDLTSIDQIYGERHASAFRDFPEEVVNSADSDYLPRRRRTEPPRSEFSAAATETLRALDDRYRDINFVYDPHVENRLRKYMMTPSNQSVASMTSI